MTDVFLPNGSLNAVPGNVPVGTEQQYLVSVTMDSLGPLGTFDKFTGGDADAKVTLYRPGGMGGQVSYRTLPEYATVTVSRAYQTTGDPALVASLRAFGEVGGDFGTITVQPLDSNGTPFGSPAVYYGRLSNVKPGQVDSSSGNPRMMELEFAIQAVSG